MEIFLLHQRGIVPTIATLQSTINVPVRATMINAMSFNSINTDDNIDDGVNYVESLSVVEAVSSSRPWRTL